MKLQKIILFFILFFFSLSVSFCQTDNKPAIDSLKVQRLAGLCRVWGFLKYYHPTIQKGKIDWDSTLVHYIPKILKVSNSEEYNKTINEFILLPGKVKKLSRPYKYLPKDTSYNNFDHAWVSNDKLFTKENSRLLFEVIENYVPRENVYLNKEFNIYYDTIGFKKYYYKNEYNPDTAHALLALYRYWNIINYFFAYKKITDENWNDVLIEFIPKILKNAGNVNFYLIMVEMIAKINDCHSYYENYNFNHEINGVIKSWYYGQPRPLKVNFIENKTIITAISDSLSLNTNIKVGDIILKINGTDVNEKRKEVGKYCGCSHKLSVEREINRGLLITSLNKKEINLTVLDSNNTVKTDSFPNSPKYWQWHKGKVMQKFSDSIVYINLAYMPKNNDMKEALKMLKNTKALIFDLRNGSNESLSEIFRRIPKLNHKNAIYLKAYEYNLKYPGAFKARNQRLIFNPDWSNIDLGLITPHKKYKGKVIFLINEHAQSAEEMHLMRFKTACKVTLVGSNTSGTDGIAASYLIQKNFLAYFSGDAVFWPDGSPTQRVGIKPDIYVLPTIKGIRAGKDEILERALEYIRTGK